MVTPVPRPRPTQLTGARSGPLAPMILWSWPAALRRSRPRVAGGLLMTATSSAVTGLALARLLPAYAGQ